MLIWPWIWFVHNGEFESSKSVMYESAPELKALMTILASTGPVISTRRQCSAGGTGAIFQSPARIDEVERGRREDGLEAGLDRGVDRQAGGQVERRHGEGPWEAKKSSTSVSFVPM